MQEKSKQTIQRCIVSLKEVADWFKYELQNQGIDTYRVDVYEYLNYFIKELLDSSNEIQISESSCRTMLMNLGLDISTVSWIEHRMYLELIERLDEVFERLEDTKRAGRLYGYEFKVVGINYDLVFLIMEE